MSDLPDYSQLSPPPDKEPTEYDYHERRAEIFDRLVERGDPSAVTQARLAERYDVSEPTISNDMDRLRESVNDHLGTEARFTTRTLYQHVLRELLAADDWKATKEAWDVAMSWNQWLADVGEQDREPEEIQMDVDSRRAEVSYTVVRGLNPDDDTTDAAPLPSGDEIDDETVGFTREPTRIELEDESNE